MLSNAGNALQFKGLRADVLGSVITDNPIGFYSNYKRRKYTKLCDAFTENKEQKCMCHTK